MTVTSSSEDLPPCQGCKTTIDIVKPFGFCRTCIDVHMGRISQPSETPKPPKPLLAPWTLQGVLGSSNSNMKPIRTVAVNEDLAKHLKPHQKEGVEFIWKNCFSDCNFYDTGKESEIGGCVLAHFMGLGKSLTTLSLLHTALKSPSLVSTATSTKRRLFRTVLLVVPANTLPNWENEVDKWTGDLDMPLKAFNLGSKMAGYRGREIDTWKSQGGLMFMADAMFLKEGDDILKRAQPDIVVLDEAHTMLKCSRTKTFKKLQEIKTKRRILLTGTPLQNNVTEYYHLVEFIRPGVMGVASTAEFEDTYRFPIQRGLPSDAALVDKLESLQKRSELKCKLDPYVHRKSASVLRKDLPPIQDTLLYLQQSKVQTKILRLYRKKQDEEAISKNFFKTYADLAPVLNHPGNLKIKKGGSGQKISWKNTGDQWLVENGIKPAEYDKLCEARNSPKLIILAHLIAMAFKLEEKMLIYSKCLKTLDMVEHFLCSPDWKRQIGSLKDEFPELKLGGLKKSKDFIRIDGSVQSGKRGLLVDKFNNDAQGIKIFLISSEAGGIGINLCSASIVAILDNHFNPSVSQQCVSRTHRYGQTKTVRCFRFAIENTMEAKVYARSENKVGVAKSVLDGMFSEGVFSADELGDLYRNETIVTCDKCNKRRVLPDTQTPPGDDESWECGLNDDKKHNSCKIPEESNVQNSRETEALDNEPILQHLLSVINKATRKTRLVRGLLPVEVSHEEDICCEDAIKKLKKEMKRGAAQRNKAATAMCNTVASKRNIGVLASKDKNDESASKSNGSFPLPKIKHIPPAPKHTGLDEEDDNDEIEVVAVKPPSKRKPDESNTFASDVETRRQRRF